ncbi:MAG: rod shape-determining protein MreC [Pseudomonadota bacterium]
MHQLFEQRASATTRIILLSIASIVLMTVDHRWHYLDRVRASLNVVIAPIRYVVSFPIATAEWLSYTLSNQQQLLEENRRLKENNFVLNVRLQRFDELQQENLRLRSLIEPAQRFPERTLLAGVMDVEMDPYLRRIVLNKGSHQGVSVGMPVLDALGVIGKTISVDVLSSVVMLVTDVDHMLPVQIKRTGHHTVTAGNGKESLNVLYLPVTTDVVVGDELVTSGIGGVFPAGYAVGVITKIQRDTGKPFAIIEAKPTALLNRSRDVLLLLPPKS